MSEEKKEIKLKSDQTKKSDQAKETKSGNKSLNESKNISNDKMIAVVRIRGSIDVNTQILDTLKMLHLWKKNSCIVFVPSASAMGMLIKAKDYITWGEINQETLSLLTEKRKAKEKSFHLNPPRKGFGRKGIKVPFNKGGALGYRGEKMNDLIQRML
jgi:large subunit ribosomal protein L30